MKTKNIIEKQIEEMIDVPNMRKTLISLVNKAISSGAIDSSQIKREDYTTAKVLLSIYFENLSMQFAPLSQSAKEEKENLTYFI